MKIHQNRFPFIFCLFLFSFLIFNSSCTKEGPIGPAGIDGTNGKDGNANVSSRELFIEPTHWTAVGVFGTPNFHRTLEIPIPALTTSIASTGLVLVYFKSAGTDNWRQLPYTRTTSSFTEVFDFTHKSGLITLKVEASDNRAFAHAGTIRIVLATKAGRVRAEGDVDFGNLHEVEDFFNLTN